MRGFGKIFPNLTIGDKSKSVVKNQLHKNYKKICILGMNNYTFCFLCYYCPLKPFQSVWPALNLSISTYTFNLYTIYSPFNVCFSSIKKKQQINQGVGKNPCNFNTICVVSWKNIKIKLFNFCHFYFAVCRYFAVLCLHKHHSISADLFLAF